MRRVALLVLALPLFTSATARAERERAAALSVHGGGAVIGDADAVGPDRFGSVIAASLAWDRPAPDFPAPGTARARGDLVPELTLMALGDRGVALAGARLELDLAQSKMGLLQVSARMSLYIAPRIGLIDEGGSAVLGGDFGEIYYLGRSDWRIGFDFGVLTWREEDPGQVVLDGATAFRVDPGTRQIAMYVGLVVTR